MTHPGHRPQEVAPQQVIQQGGVDLHPGINGGHRGGLQVQEARGGEPHQDPLAGEIRRRVDGGEAVLAAYSEAMTLAAENRLWLRLGPRNLRRNCPWPSRGMARSPTFRAPGVNRRGPGFPKR